MKAVSYIVVFGDVEVQNEKDQQKHNHKLSVKKTSLIKWHGVSFKMLMILHRFNQKLKNHTVFGI